MHKYKFYYLRDKSKEAMYIFDAPNIEAVVIARPTLSVVLYSQMIGRGIRGPLFGGTHSTTIVNVEDNIANLPDFRSAFTYFNKFF